MTEQFWLVVTDDWKYFRVTVTEKTPAVDGKQLISVQGIVEEVVAWNSDNENESEFEHYLSFYMKWDECCHINFGDKAHPGYLHLCGHWSWQRHNQLMTELYEWAAKTIPMRV